MSSPNKTRSDCQTLVDIMRLRAAVDPDMLAYRFLESGDVDGPAPSLTYKEVDLRARTIAARLQSLGLAGERALLIFPPGLDYVAAFFGCTYAGVIAVPAYPPDPSRLNRTVPRLTAIIEDSGA